VCDHRHVGLRWPKLLPPADLAGGRLIGYEPDKNLYDGAAEVCSNGFFDVDNTPAWDTWVAYVAEPSGPEYLLSWIPPALLDLANGGVDANPEVCIWWLDEEKPGLWQMLVAAAIAPGGES
jgi:hypothetical protein